MRMGGGALSHLASFVCVCLNVCLFISGCAGLSLLYGLFVIVQSGGCSPVAGFSMWWLASLLLGSRAQAQWLWLVGLAAPQHVRCLWTKDRACFLHWQVDSLTLSHQVSPVVCVCVCVSIYLFGCVES